MGDTGMQNFTIDEDVIRKDEDKMKAKGLKHVMRI